MKIDKKKLRKYIDRIGITSIILTIILCAVCEVLTRKGIGGAINGYHTETEYVTRPSPDSEEVYYVSKVAWYADYILAAAGLVFFYISFLYIAYLLKYRIMPFLWSKEWRQ